MAAVPSIPRNLTSTSFTSSSVFLSWSPSTETGGTIAGYNIFRNTTSTPIATTTATNYFDAGPLTPAAQYTYYVSAFDSSGAASGLSKAYSVTTQAPGSTVPNNYVVLYNELQGQINLFTSYTSAWSGNLYPVNYSAELLSVNDNYCPCGGPGSSGKIANMMAEVNRNHFIGMQAATVKVGWPFFDVNYYMTPAAAGGLGQSASQAKASVQQNLAFYQQVQSYIHSLGMKMLAKTYLPFPSAVRGLAAYWKTLGPADVAARWSSDNVVVATQIQPDEMALQAEPGTEASTFTQLGNIPVADLLSSPTADSAMIAQFVSDIRNAGVSRSATRLAAGASSFASANWGQYVMNEVSISGLDDIDAHMYNLQANAVTDINGTAATDEFTTLIESADLASANGKGFIMSELWPFKSDKMVDLSGNGDPSKDVQARNAMSFWSPLDDSFAIAMIRLANWKQLNYLSFYGQGYESSYLNYGLPSPSLPCIPFFPQNGKNNLACDKQIDFTLSQIVNQDLYTTPIPLSDFGVSLQADIAAYGVTASGALKKSPTHP